MRFTKMVLISSAALLLAFQNCSPVDFKVDDSMSGSLYGPPQPNFAEMKIGPDQSFPPLKLVFVVDNSGTMGVNQINLSKAFEKMFEGDNATNLGPFESNAILISTSQASVEKTDSILARLPSQSVDQIADMAYPTLLSTYRGATLNGSVPGDLVGYRLQKTTNGAQTSLEYFPAPLTSFSPFGMKSRASQFVHLARGGDIEAFKADFRARLDLLNPARSATVTTNGVTTGILDPIVDKESGLCSIARVLKKNEGLVNPGELTAFIIVTDEDDSDPSGARCLEAIRDLNGADDLYDGRCERAQTKLSYRQANPNPAQPKCTVSYRKGFSYSYSYPVARTSLTFYREKYTYSLPRTAITYYTYAGYDHDSVTTPVTYYKSAPTYQIPQTKITYYREVENCTIRDGIKTNCTYTYPSTDITVAGSYNNNCAAFVSGKLPTGALTTKAGYLPTCAVAPAVNASGPCTVNDPDKINCNQNYSAALQTSLAGSPTSGCAAFVAGRLPAGSLYTTAGYLPACGTPVTANIAVATGSCPTSGVVNCRNKPLATNATTVDQTFASPTTCAQFVKSKKSEAVTDQLGTYPVSCSAAAPTTGKTAYGTCPTTNINVTNCSRTPELQAAKIFDGVPTNGQTCAQFAGTVSGLPSNTIYTAGTYEPTCASAASRTAGPVSGSFLFTDAQYTSFAGSKGDACPQGLVTNLTSTLGVAPSSCTIGDPSSGSQDFLNATCAATDVLGVCSNSGGTKKNCTATETPAGSAYATNLTTATYDGSFTCDTKCSDTTFCKTAAGTVRDNYYECSTTALNPKTISSYTANKAPACLAGDTRIDTKGPYNSVETVKYPVVDKPTVGTDKLSEYIKARSADLFGENTPFVSVFARQPGDTLGTNGSIGAAYNRFADSMGGTKSSVLSDADGYAVALQGLSGLIRERLTRSFSIGVMAPGDKIHRVWHRHAGQTSWGPPVDPSLWTANGNALTVGKDVVVEYGDEFRIEYW